MRGRNLLSALFVFLLVVNAPIIGLVLAPPAPPTIFVDPPTCTAQPGEYVTINVNVTGVSPDRGVSGWEFKLAYDVSLLRTQTDWITEGDFLSNVGSTYFTRTFKPAESAWLIGCMFTEEVTASGSGGLAEIKFEVMGEGSTTLDIFDSKLNDIDVINIPHDTTDGYFSNIVIGDLMRRSAWPEHHHFSISGDEDGIQTLYGKVKNLGEGHGYLRVQFTVWKMDGKVLIFIGKYNATQETKVMPGEIVDVSVDLWESRETAWATGKYYVNASCLYSADGLSWGTGAKTKAFSFSVVS